MQGFLGKTLQQQSSINKAQLTHYTVNALQVYGQEKYLLVCYVSLYFQCPLQLNKQGETKNTKMIFEMK